MTLSKLECDLKSETSRNPTAGPEIRSVIQLVPLDPEWETAIHHRGLSRLGWGGWRRGQGVFSPPPAGPQRGGCLNASRLRPQDVYSIMEDLTTHSAGADQVSHRPPLTYAKKKGQSPQPSQSRRSFVLAQLRESVLKPNIVIGFIHYLFQLVLSQPLLFVDFIQIIETIALSLVNPTVLRLWIIQFQPRTACSMI